MRYTAYSGTSQNSMSVRFNSTGTQVLALRRRLAPILYTIHCSDPVVEFYHQDYYNSCTMKSCSFAGEGDEFVLSGSDDFNLYMWKIPELGDSGGRYCTYFFMLYQLPLAFGVVKVHQGVSSYTYKPSS